MNQKKKPSYTDEQVKILSQNLDAQKTSTSIKEMQQRIVHLEQQVEF